MSDVKEIIKKVKKGEDPQKLIEKMTTIEKANADKLDLMDINLESFGLSNKKIKK